MLADQFGKHIGKSSLNHSPREFVGCAVECERIMPAAMENRRSAINRPAEKCRRRDDPGGNRTSARALMTISLGAGWGSTIGLLFRVEAWDWVICICAVGMSCLLQRLRC
jgi:hypothetical protein